MGVQETSLEAYFTKVVPRLGRRQQQVFQVFLDNPYVDFTNMEVARELGWSINRVTPRVLELRKKSLLIYSVTRKCHVTKNDSMAWRLPEWVEWK